MAAIQDIWYVRLPDGRIIRSRNVVSLRYHLRTGRIPPTSRVRHGEGDTWQALQDVRELAEAAAAALARQHQANGVNPVNRRKRNRIDFQEWRLLGVRGLVRELLDALDSSLHRTKMGVACFLGMLGGVAWTTGTWLPAELDGGWWTAAAAAWVVVLVAAVCMGISLITQVTAFELSRMRAPRPAELWPSVLGHAMRLAVALVLVVGTGAVLFVMLRWLPEWMLPADSAWWDYAAAATLSLRLILEVVFWPVIALAPLLISPILVVQDCSFLAGIRQWWGLLRQHLGRIFLYEVLATTLAAVFTLPLLIPIGLAYWSLGSMSGLQLLVGQATIAVLSGIALTPLISYLLVANVFIYLNLRYEFFHSAR